MGEPKARGIHRDIYVSTCVSEIPVHAQSADQEVIAEGKVDTVGIFLPYVGERVYLYSKELI